MLPRSARARRVVALYAGALSLPLALALYMGGRLFATIVALVGAILAEIHLRSTPHTPAFSPPPQVKRGPGGGASSVNSAYPTCRIWLNTLILTTLCAGAAHAQPLPPPSLTPDTLTAQLRYDAVALSVARTELRSLTSWRRLLPKLRLFSSVSSRGVLFAPVNPATGYDPYASALARWPGDTWGLTVSWDLDQLLDDQARRAARGAVALAIARSALTRERLATALHADSLRAAREAAREAERRADEHHRLAEERLRLTAELAALERRRALMATEQRFADAELAHRRDLLRLSEIAHTAGGPYEALARARLALLDAERARVRLDAEALDLDARHALARDARARLEAHPPAPLPLSPAPPPSSPSLTPPPNPGEVARSAGGGSP